MSFIKKILKLFLLLLKLLPKALEVTKLWLNRFRAVERLEFKKIIKSKGSRHELTKVIHIKMTKKIAHPIITTVDKSN